jgi:hypothetical protein
MLVAGVHGRVIRDEAMAGSIRHRAGIESAIQAMRHTGGDLKQRARKSPMVHARERERRRARRQAGRTYFLKNFGSKWPETAAGQAQAAINLIAIALLAGWVFRRMVAGLS